MIIGSMNIRGVGNALKRIRISALIKKGNAEIFMIQEKKITSLKEEITKSFWSSGDIGYSFSNYSGRSRGLIILWKPD